MIAAILIAIALTQAQDFEYGKRDEMRGLTKIYVYTDLDLSARERIVREIQTRLPEVTLVEHREDAELVLFYGQDSRREFRGTVGSGQPNGSGGVNTSSTPVFKKIVSGVGWVLKPGAGGKRDRLLMDFKDERNNLFERKPTVNFARAFVKAYKEANK